MDCVRPVVADPRCLVACEEAVSERWLGAAIRCFAFRVVQEMEAGKGPGR